MESKLKSIILDVHDFPKKGIIFKDLSPIFRDENIFAELVNHLGQVYKDMGINRVAGIESRGFIIGAPLALKLGASFIPVRKPGKLPRETYREEYELEYGTDALEVHKDAFAAGDKVLIIDDLLATGGTAAATVALIKKTGADVAGIGFVVELDFLKGREKLNGINITSIVHY